MMAREAGDAGLFRAGGAAAIGAGVAGLAGLISTLPWPELFALDANPGNAIVFEPGLRFVLLGHYAILVVGGLLGLAAGAMLMVGLRRAPAARVGAASLAGGSLVFAYAATARLVDLGLHEGRSTGDLQMLVFAGGAVFLAGMLVMSWALRRTIGRTLFVLGVIAPLLVAGAIVVFMVVGPDVYPEIWGVTFPPPSDYLLAIWFIGLGLVLRRGSPVR